MYLRDATPNKTMRNVCYPRILLVINHDLYKNVYRKYISFSQSGYFLIFMYSLSSYSLYLLDYKEANEKQNQKIMKKENFYVEFG